MLKQPIEKENETIVKGIMHDSFKNNQKSKEEQPIDKEIDITKNDTINEQSTVDKKEELKDTSTSSEVGVDTTPLQEVGSITVDYTNLDKTSMIPQDEYLSFEDKFADLSLRSTKVKINTKDPIFANSVIVKEINFAIIKLSEFLYAIKDDLENIDFDELPNLNRPRDVIYTILNDYVGLLKGFKDLSIITNTNLDDLLAQIKYVDEYLGDVIEDEDIRVADIIVKDVVTMLALFTTIKDSTSETGPFNLEILFSLNKDLSTIKIMVKLTDDIGAFIDKVEKIFNGSSSVLELNQVDEMAMSVIFNSEETEE